MGGYGRHIFEQGRGLAALGRLLTARKSEHGPVSVPGPKSSWRVAPPSAELATDFVRFAGGDPSAYRGVIPPHLFPQWSLPAMLEVARTLPYPPTKVINAGCRLCIFEPLPIGETLEVSAQLTDVDDNGQRALIGIRVSTGSASVQQALQADIRVYVPLKAPGSGDAAAKKKPRREKPRVPREVRELDYQRLAADAGWRFACLTGDFNPIHWLGPYARAAGFRRVILHGFGSFARVFEGLVRTRLAGDQQLLTELQADFTRPLVLPASVGLYLRGDREVFFGDAPGGAAYLVGRFALRGD